MTFPKFTNALPTSRSAYGIQEATAQQIALWLHINLHWDEVGTCDSRDIAIAVLHGFTEICRFEQSEKEPDAPQNAVNRELIRALQAYVKQEMAAHPMAVEESAEPLVVENLDYLMVDPNEWG